MYSNSTYSKDSQLAGTVFKLKIIDDGDIKKASPNSFYLKYDVGYYKDLDGDEIDSLDNVSSKTGYTLIRYDDSNGHEVIDNSGNFLSKIAFDNTNTSKKEGEIRPVWSANTYVVSFNPGKGTLDGNSNKDVVYDSKYGDVPTASRAGYSFDGWYTSETGGSKVTSDTPVKITNNQTLYARYTPNKIDYLVRYDQENAQDENYTTKETITLNADMDSEVTVKPKTYTGFKTPSEQKITIKESGNSVTFQYKRNVAKIKLNANGGKLNADDGYNVKFSLKDDGTVLTNGNVYYQNIKHEQVLGTSGLANPDNKSYINLKKTGYRIPDKSEWCTKADGTGTCYQDDNSAENDPTYTSVSFCDTSDKDCGITLYVHWVARTYTVTFAKNDGSGDNAGTRTVTYDAKYGTLPTLSRTGYTFTGWFTAASGGTQVTSDTIVKITEAQTLYAHWTPNKYTVTFIKNDGTSNNVGTSNVTFGSAYGTLPTPSRTGYTFSGWYTAASGGTRIIDSTKVSNASNHNLYAHWVDKTLPTCVVTKSNQSSTGLTLTVKCTDAGSGCVEATKTYNNVTTSQTYQVEDNAGNVKTCDTATVTKATVYRKRTCSSCKSCGWVSRYSCSRGTLINRNCVWTVTKSCRNCPNCTLDHWDSKAKVSYYTCSESAVANGGYYNYPNNCGTCGCGSWGSWSDYNLSSCAGSSSVQCESTTIYQ